MKAIILMAAMSVATALICSAMAQQSSAPASAPSSSAPPAAPASSGPAAPTPSVTSTVATPTTPAASPAPAADAQKGHIYFFRPARLSGAIYTYHVREVAEDGKVQQNSPQLGGLSNNGYFVADVEPGIHNYNVSGPMAINKDSDRIRLEVEPGETYYITLQERMGFMTSGFRLVPATAERFQSIQVHLHNTATTKTDAAEQH